MTGSELCNDPGPPKAQKKQSRCCSLSVSLSNSKEQLLSNMKHLFTYARIKTSRAAAISLQKGLAGNERESRA
jgi:predicted transcriptional regulator